MLKLSSFASRHTLPLLYILESGSPTPLTRNISEIPEYIFHCGLYLSFCTDVCALFWIFLDAKRKTKSRLERTTLLQLTVQ